MKTVERGAALLDERLPGWENRIDLRKLDLGSSCNCVLGQLHRTRGQRRVGAYARGLDALGIRTAEKFGFTVWSSGSFSNLTVAWRELIERRRVT